MIMQADKFTKELSKRTPWIVLEPGRIFIMGRSIPDDPGDFYEPVLEWVTNMVPRADGKMRVDLGFEYINTSSTKWLYLILRKLSEVKDLSAKANVTWYYELDDDDMSELGFILRSVLDCPFLVSEVPQMNKAQYERILKGES